MPAEARIEDEAAKALVELVPAELPESAMTDDVADELLSAIGDRHAGACQKPCERLRPRVVNQWIGEYLKDLLGAEIGRAVPSTDRNCLTEVLSGEGLQAAACQNGKRHGRLCQAGRGRRYCVILKTRAGKRGGTLFLIKEVPHARLRVPTKSPASARAARRRTRLYASSSGRSITSSGSSRRAPSSTPGAPGTELAPRGRTGTATKIDDGPRSRSGWMQHA